jgi:hypothetical protein
MAAGDVSFIRFIPIQLKVNYGEHNCLEVMRASVLPLFSAASLGIPLAAASVEGYLGKKVSSDSSKACMLKS